MNKQQTAVEWIEEEYMKGNIILPILFQQAKEMEKSQISKSYEKGWVNGDLKKAPRFGSEYYDNQYKKNE
jgi:hypothetical protein